MKVISSKTTFFHKFIAPAFVTIIIGYFVYQLFVWESGSPFMTILFVILLAGFVYWFHLRVKRVAICGDALLVSNYFKEIEIPFSNVNKITTIYIKGHPTTIHLKLPSEFGRKILFIPPINWLSWAPHKNVAELREMVKNRHKELREFHFKCGCFSD